MGREVRMVPQGWEHPKDQRGRHVPLHNRDILDHYEDGEEIPSEDRLMPEFPDGTATWIMMYETCSEGTPISPSFETAEELARWLADTGASAFGSMEATYDQWLATIKAGWAPSMIMDGQGLRPGVSIHDDRMKGEKA